MTAPAQPRAKLNPFAKLALDFGTRPPLHPGRHRHYSFADLLERGDRAQ